MHDDNAHAWVRSLGGRFLVFEGPDGSGKSTQFRRFASLLAQHGVPVCEVREPGGTAIGEEIRRILLDHAHDDMTLACEMLLYMASRAQLVQQRIRPALDQRHAVLADRFVASTIAYQGAAGGMPISDILDVARVALAGVHPHLTVIFDVDERTAAARMSPLLDRMEAKGAQFHARVRRGYLDLARSDPDHYAVIDASRDEQAVWEDLLRIVRTRTTGPGAPA